MECSRSDLVLRRITIFAFVPCFAFLLPYGIVTGGHGNKWVPSLSLIPMGLSSFSGLIFVSGKAKNRVFNCLLDIFVALYLLAMLIASAILVSNYHNWWRTNSLVMVGTYGTVPLMVNFVIHTYFALKAMHATHFLKLAFTGAFSSTMCPHCQRETLFKWGIVSPDSSSGHKSYASVPAQADDYDENAEDAGQPSSSKGPNMMSEYKDPRPSTDDENARLV